MSFPKGVTKMVWLWSIQIHEFSKARGHFQFEVGHLLTVGARCRDLPNLLDGEDSCWMGKLRLEQERQRAVRQNMWQHFF